MTFVMEPADKKFESHHCLYPIAPVIKQSIKQNAGVRLMKIGYTAHFFKLNPIKSKIERGLINSLSNN